MTASLPLLYRWTGEGMTPLPRFMRQCDAEFVIGDIYLLARHEDRSAASHAHYFASVSEAWKNLPEHMSDRWPTADHLRKFALIQTGHRDERSIVCSSKAEARKLAAFIKPMDEYAVVAVSEAVVSVFTAQSQSMRAMGRAAFQRSKDDVLGCLAGLISVTPEALEKNAGMAA